MAHQSSDNLIKVSNVTIWFWWSFNKIWIGISKTCHFFPGCRGPGGCHLGGAHARCRTSVHRNVSEPTSLLTERKVAWISRLKFLFWELGVIKRQKSKVAFALKRVIGCLTQALPHTLLKGGSLFWFLPHTLPKEALSSDWKLQLFSWPVQRWRLYRLVALPWLCI